MKRADFTIKHTRRLTADTWELVLSGDTSGVTAPGQFVNLSLPGRFLRRPISVCSWTAGGLLLVVKEAGAGTRELVRLPAGTRLEALTGLGNGFDVTKAGARPVLAGGGVGTAPLYGLAKALTARGAVPDVVLGFRSGADAFYLEEFTALGCPLSAAAEDGTLGVRGFVTDLLKTRTDRDALFVCGPAPMLKAVHALGFSNAQYSFEARMGCGFGACMGCSVPTACGMRRVCKDGPVFAGEEIVWQT